MTQEELRQVLATAQEVNSDPDAPVVVILHPSTLNRIHPSSFQSALLAGVRVETDPEMDPAIICIVLRSQLTTYDRARRWVGPWKAVNAAARIEEYQQAHTLPTYQHTWTAEPTEPVKPRAVQQPRRRFPIPR